MGRSSEPDTMREMSSRDQWAIQCESGGENLDLLAHIWGPKHKCNPSCTYC